MLKSIDLQLGFRTDPIISAKHIYNNVKHIVAIVKHIVVIGEKMP